LCLVPVSEDFIWLLGVSKTFAWFILFISFDKINAPSIFDNSINFCGVNLQLILNPPSIIGRRDSFSTTINAPFPVFNAPSIAVRRLVPGATNFRIDKNSSGDTFSLFDFISESCTSLFCSMLAKNIGCIKIYL